MKRLISSVLLLGTLVSSTVGVYADEPEKTEKTGSVVFQQAVKVSKASSAVEAYVDELEFDRAKRNLTESKSEVQTGEATQQASENPKFFDETKEKFTALKGKAAESFDGAKIKLAELKGKTSEFFEELKEMISKYKEENPRIYEELFNCISVWEKTLKYLPTGNFGGIARTMYIDRKNFQIV